MRAACVRLLALLACVLANAGSPSAGRELQVTLENDRGAVSPLLYGAFLEEINHAVAGGLHAELLGCRGLWEARRDELDAAWAALPRGGAEAPLASSLADRNGPLNANRTASLRVPLDDLAGVANVGFPGGFAVRAGAAYDATLFVRCGGAVQGLAVALEDATSGETLASATLQSCGGSFARASVRLSAGKGAEKARLAVRGRGGPGATLWIGWASLVPADAELGFLRPDIFALLRDARFGFLRFPGGCFVQGVRLDDAFRWKRTVGPQWERPAQQDSTWGYATDNGMGFLEYLELAEALGAAPIWVVNAGAAIAEEVPTYSHEAWQTGVHPYVQDVLDGIEYATGDVSTPFGALRAKHGRPKPFVLEYVAIGNEACNTPLKEYPGNYLAHFQAISAKHPDITLVANCDLATGTANGFSFPHNVYPGHNYPPQPIPWPAPLSREQVPMYDFHTYADANWFAAQTDFFEAYNRSWPAVFVSEFGAQCPRNPPPSSGMPPCTTGTVYNALREAAWMLGLERNGDAVRLAAYAPLLQNAAWANWAPNMIHFDASMAWGTPSYWVQRLFARRRGAVGVRARVSAPNASSPAPALLHVSATRPGDGAQILVKLVNLDNATAVQLSVGLGPWRVCSTGGDEPVLETVHGPEAAENSFAAPTLVTATSTAVPASPGARAVAVELPPSSASVLVVPVAPRKPHRAARRSSARYE